MINAKESGTFLLGGKLTIHRLGFGAMRLTGPGIWGEPKNPKEAQAVLKRAIEFDVNFIDTADSYGPEVSENQIAHKPTRIAQLGPLNCKNLRGGSPHLLFLR